MKWRVRYTEVKRESIRPRVLEQMIATGDTIPTLEAHLEARRGDRWDATGSLLFDDAEWVAFRLLMGPRMEFIHELSLEESKTTVI